MSKFDRLFAKAKEYQTSTYLRKFVARDFQLMVRAEAGALEIPVAFVDADGTIGWNHSYLGECTCVTCGKVGPWKGGTSAAGGGMHTGHFIASRCNSIVLEENNVAPQCARCNLYGGGEQEKFTIWMRAVRGQDEIDRLRELKTTVRKFNKEELVVLRIGYMNRLKRAKEVIDAAATT